MSPCGKPTTASSTASPVCWHILFLIPTVFKTGPDSATKKKKMFQELDHWFVQDFTPIWNWTWLCNKMASTGKNLSLRVQPEEKPLVSEPQNKPPTFAMEDNFTWKNWQTSRVYSDFRHWDLTGGFLWGFFFSTEWSKVSLQGKQTTLFFFYW